MKQLFNFKILWADGSGKISDKSTLGKSVGQVTESLSKIYGKRLLSVTKDQAN